MPSEMPEGAGVDEMLKTMKTTCATKESVGTETIQGIQAEERDVTCTTTMSMPAGVQQGTRGAMTGMSMKIVMRTWSATPGERVRVPGLWQLSGFELWQKYFMNPTGGFNKMMPDVMAPMVQALNKNQLVTLRMTMEMSMNFPSPVPLPAGAAADTPFIKMSREAVEISTAPLDDSLFAIPGDCTAEPFADLMNGIQAAAIQAIKTAKAAKTTPEPAIPPDVKAYVPLLSPATATEPVLPDEARANHIQGTVQVLVTVGPRGSVERAEALSGPEALRKAAIDTVRQWTYRPVIRSGAPVAAYTDADVYFFDRSNPAPPAAGFQFPDDMAAAGDRLAQLEEAFPRTPEQKFADSEQDAAGDNKTRRFYKLNGLAVKAAQLGFNDKAKTYAVESLAAAEQHAKDWNYGNAIHDGHMVLALRNNDVPTAREELIKAGQTPGSPQLNSFGPNMALANELLQKGERNTVLEYFGLCRKFWKTGAPQLDSWSETVRNVQTPAFGGNLR
jgi:TonB family protein